MLNFVYINQDAQNIPVVTDFFRNQADFNGYVVWNEDKATHNVASLDMEIIAS